MKQWGFIILSCLCFTGTAAANCDLSRFRWECDMPVNIKPNHGQKSLIYCGNIPLYVTKAEYDCISRYQRASVNLILSVNGEYIDSPCIPAGRDTTHAN